MSIASTLDSVLLNSSCVATSVIVDEALDKMANAITRDLSTLNPVVICVMTGGIITTGHLMTRLKFPLELSYLHITRYKDKLIGGDLDVVMLPTDLINNRNVLIVDDIFDEGFTMELATNECLDKGAASVKSAVLVVKDRKRTCKHSVNYYGIKAPNKFLYGYGLDYKGYFRNLNKIMAYEACHDTCG